jgi:hypothetical protein
VGEVGEQRTHHFVHDSGVVQVGYCHILQLASLIILEVHTTPGLRTAQHSPCTGRCGSGCGAGGAAGRAHWPRPVHHSVSKGASLSTAHSAGVPKECMCDKASTCTLVRPRAGQQGRCRWQGDQGCSSAGQLYGLVQQATYARKHNSYNNIAPARPRRGISSAM